MKKIIVSLSLLIIFFLMLLFPQPVKAGAQTGLTLWYHSVVPILLPFLILSNVILSTGSLNLFLQPLFALSGKVPGLNPWIFYPLFFGLFCGFPMGGKTIDDLLHAGKLTLKEADFLLPLVNQASPMFIIGYVGVHVLNNTLSLAELLFFLYTPPLAVLFAFLLGNCIKNKNSGESSRLSVQKNSMSRNSEHTIWNAFTVIVMIGMYMMVFTIALGLCNILLPDNPLIHLLLSCLEFSIGLHQITGVSFLSSHQKTGLVLALTSFGGLCTAVQTMGVIKDRRLSFFSYVCRKLIISFIVYLLYMLYIY